MQQRTQRASVIKLHETERRLILCILAASLMTGCGNKERLEDTSYFNDVTGLNICRTFTIKNANYDKFDRMKDSNYKVIIHLNQTCYYDLKRQISLVGKINCSSRECISIDSKQNFYILSNWNNGVAEFTLKFSS